MTQAYNLSQLANNLNTAGQLDATDGLVNAVPVVNGGTGATTAADARTNLNVPSTTGGGASGTWAINISGNAANGGVTSVNGATGAVSVPVGIPQQLFLGSGTFVVPAGVTAVYATVIGGGGGGQGGGYNSGGFSGGSSTSQTVLVTGLTPGASIPVTVGAGGAGGAGNNGSGAIGSNGGTSSFGSYVSVTGGQGGGTTLYSTMTSSYIKQITPMIGGGGLSGPAEIEGYSGGGGGGAGWSSGGGGGAGSFAPVGQFGAGGAAYNGSAGFPGGTAGGSAPATAGGAGGSNPSYAQGGAGGAIGPTTYSGGGGGGGGAGAVLLRW